MKKILTLAVAVIYAGCAGKNDGQKDGQRQKQFPKPGTIVAQDSIPITEDKLNHFVFSVKVIADSNITAGTYDVDADFGPYYSTSTFTMPASVEDAVPYIKKGSAPYTFIIGFKVPGDTAAYDYFEVSSNRSQTKMKYIKAYTF